MTEPFESPRARNERLRAERARVFDSFVDLALKNVISLDDAVRRYKVFIGFLEQPEPVRIEPSEGGDAR